MFYSRDRSPEQSNFTYLVIDIAWFGLALAATSRFLSLYAIRLGADSIHLALIASLPGIALLFSTSISGWWRRRFPDSIRAIYLPSIGFRMVFLLPALTPFFPSEWQPIWLVLSVALPAIPQGIAGTIFLVLMRESVSEGRMNSLLSRRMIVLNICVAMGTLFFWLLLENLPFPLNYQLMFVIAFCFTMMSLWYVARLRVIFPMPAPETHVKPRALFKSGKIMGIMFATLITHIAFFSVIAITPVHLIENLGADETYMMLFGLLELTAGAAISLFTDRLIRRFGAVEVVAGAMVGTALAAVFFATAPNLPIALIGAFVSGAAWTATAIGLMAMLFNNVPREQSQAASMMYQQVAAIGIFVGPLIGNVVESMLTILPAVLIFGAVLRLLSAVLTHMSAPEVSSYGLRLFCSPRLGVSHGRSRSR